MEQSNLARTLFGYCYLLRNKNGEVFGLAYAPPEAAEALTEEEKRRLPLVSASGNIIEEQQS